MDQKLLSLRSTVIFVVSVMVGSYARSAAEDLGVVRSDALGFVGFVTTLWVVTVLHNLIDHKSDH